jgi:hypothetical protein
VLCALMSVPTVSWIIDDIKAHERRAAREKRLNATEHQHEPLRRADLDRG